MRKVICLIVTCAITILCLGGCAGSLSPSTTGDTQPSTEEATIPPVTWTPSESSEPLIQFDPDREIYFTCHNQYFTIYRFYSAAPAFQFNILSKKPLDMDTLEIDIPIESPYGLIVKEFEREGTDTSVVIGTNRPDVLKYPYYLYAIRKGMDFGKLWAYYEAMNKAKYVHTYAAYEQEYVSCRDSYWEEFEALTMDDLPVYYCYAVAVTFVHGGDTGEYLSTLKDESFTSIDITIEGVTYHEEIGEIKLTDEPNIEGAENDHNNVSGGIAGYSGAILPYNGGVWDQMLYSFTAEEDMVLTGLTLDNPRLTLGDIIVLLGTEGVESKSDWNGTDPLTVYEGEDVTIFVSLSDPLADLPEYNTKVWGVLTYETESGIYYKLSECDTGTGGYTMNMYELYAIVFEGMDTSTYWRDYMHPFQESTRYWRE